jgi:hypothetical protein
MFSFYFLFLSIISVVDKFWVQESGYDVADQVVTLQMTQAITSFKEKLKPIHVTEIKFFLSLSSSK